MYQTCKYLFCASHIVYQQMQNNNHFSLRFCIIPKRVVCVYDPAVVIPFGISDIESYLQSKQINATKMNIHHSEDTVSITNLLQTDITRRIGKISNVLCILDRRPHRRHDDR
eukprot:784008_1